MARAKANPKFIIMVGDERVEYTWSVWPNKQTNIHPVDVSKHPNVATNIGPMTEEIAKELIYLKLRSYKRGREDGIELIQKRLRKLIGV